MGLRRSVGEVSVQGGDFGERPGSILVDERASRSARAKRRGNLYALLEVTGPALGRDLVAAQLLEAVQATYHAGQGSITAGLQQAIHEVNDKLVSENRDSLSREQRTAGISCAVLRDNDLFVAQAGPAVVYLMREGILTRFPEIYPAYDETPPEDAGAAPLGVQRDVNVALFHTPVNDGDLVVLIESTLDGEGSSELPLLLENTPPAELPEAVERLAEESGAAALVVSVGVGSIGEPRASGGEANIQRPVQPAGDPIRERAARLVGQIPFRETLQKLGKGLVVLLGSLWGGLVTLVKRMLPGQIGQDTPAPPPLSQAQKLRAGPGKRPKEKSPVQPRSISIRKILAGLAIAAIPLIVAVVVIAQVQKSQAQKAELEALWKSANQNWQQAETAGTKEAKRASLASAASDLEKLIGLQKDNQEAIDLRKKVLARQDEINTVQRIAALYNLKTYPGNPRLTRVVIQDFDVFVLDKNEGRVYHHELDTSQQALKAGTVDTVLVKRGDAIGSVVVGDLIDMAWVPVGEGRPQPGLVILESNGYLVDYTPATEKMTSQRPAGTEGWQFPQLVGGRSPGRVYVLDPTPGKIWRYESTPEGFSAPHDWLTAAVDLNGVIDMAIGDSIYLLYANGQISQLSMGAPDSTFDVTQWEKESGAAARNPSAMVAHPPDEAKSIYVADRGNGRIVRASPAGKFERQYQLDVSLGQSSEVLSAISSLAVNEIGGQVLFASGNTLYIFLLP